VFAEAADAAPTETSLVNDYQLSLTGAIARCELRPDLRIVHFTHTPFCSADQLRALPTEVARELCAALADNPAGFHTERWARPTPTRPRRPSSGRGDRPRSPQPRP
jgi:trehalose 6-phosphate synthase